MSELAYVGSALLVTLIGSGVIWLRSRRPVSLESGVDDFARGLQALRVETSPRSRRSG